MTESPLYRAFMQTRYAEHADSHSQQLRHICGQYVAPIPQWGSVKYWLEKFPPTPSGLPPSPASSAMWIMDHYSGTPRDYESSLYHVCVWSSGCAVWIPTVYNASKCDASTLSRVILLKMRIICYAQSRPSSSSSCVCWRYNRNVR